MEGKSIPIVEEVISLPGSELFWSSGTWLFFVGQAAVWVLALYLYYFQGRKEREAQNRHSVQSR